MFRPVLRQPKSASACSDKQQLRQAWSASEPAVGRAAARCCLVLAHVVPLRPYLLQGSNGWQHLHQALAMQAQPEKTPLAAAVQKLSPPGVVRSTAAKPAVFHSMKWRCGNTPVRSSAAAAAAGFTCGHRRVALPRPSAPPRYSTPFHPTPFHPTPFHPHAGAHDRGSAVSRGAGGTGARRSAGPGTACRGGGLLRATGARDRRRSAGSGLGALVRGGWCVLGDIIDS
jgi:hypothetical protein